MKSADVVSQYLARLDLAEAPPVTPKGLRAIHEAHLFSVPFENLSINLKEKVPLTHRAFAEKVALSRRGGICYELNGALYWLLKRLGFDVTLASSRVWVDGGLTHPGDHMVVLVNFDSRKGEVWIADVGFGAHAMKPLKLTKAGSQHDATGDYTVRPAGAGWHDVLRGDVPIYRIEPGIRSLTDFRAVYWWQQTSPDSRNTQRTICSLPTANGRVTISNNELTRTKKDSRRVELMDDKATLSAYREYFGIELDGVPRPRFPLLWSDARS